MGKGLSQWEETRDLAGRYNSQMITRKFILGEVNLEGEELKAAVLSVDFISFPHFAGSVEAKKALALLNLFISQITKCVEETGGVIDKILGSKLIAIWGVPVSQDDFTADVMNSIKSALLMRKALAKYNSDQKNPNQPFFRMACGIHAGTVLAGSMGIQHYSVYTVAGEPVSDAIKYGEMSVLAETDIVISKAVRDLAGNGIIAEEINLPGQNEGELNIFGLVNLTSDLPGQNKWQV